MAIIYKNITICCGYGIFLIFSGFGKHFLEGNIALEHMRREFVLVKMVELVSTAFKNNFNSHRIHISRF